MFCGGGRRRGRIILFAYVTHSSCDTGRISGRGDTGQPITNSEKEPQACTGTRANGASLVVQWPRTSSKKRFLSYEQQRKLFAVDIVSYWSIVSCGSDIKARICIDTSADIATELWRVTISEFCWSSYQVPRTTTTTVTKDVKTTNTIGQRNSNN